MLISSCVPSWAQQRLCTLLTSAVDNNIILTLQVVRTIVLFISIRSNDELLWRRSVHESAWMQTRHLRLVVLLELCTYISSAVANFYSSSKADHPKTFASGLSSDHTNRIFYVLCATLSLASHMVPLGRLIVSKQLHISVSTQRPYTCQSGHYLQSHLDIAPKTPCTYSRHPSVWPWVI